MFQPKASSPFAVRPAAENTEQSSAYGNTENVFMTTERSTARNLYIVDDDDAARASLQRLVARQTGFVVRGFSSGDAFLAAMDEFEPGVVLLDYHMHGANGMAVLEAIREMPSRFKTVMLTGHGGVALSVAVMKSGAVDFVEKPYEPARLITCIEAAFEQLDESRSRHMHGEAARAQLAVLSLRERDVLAGLLEGHANKVIAYNLGISPRTVEVYRCNLMTKLKARSLSQVLRIAFSAGMTEPASPPKREANDTDPLTSAII